MKKALSFVLALTLMISAAALTRGLTARAAPGDPDTLSAKVDLVVGRYNSGTKVFTPLTAGETIAQDEIIAVRIIPKTNYLVGSSYYVVMFDKNLFTIQGSNKQAFIVNTDTSNIDFDNVTALPGYTGNHYYDFACTGYAGSTIIPEEDTAWPVSFSNGEKYDVYKAIKVGTQTNSNSLTGGYPEVIPGNWLFQFRLKANQAITAGTNARIWMDARWFRSNARPNVDGYISKCLEGQLSSSAANTYNFNYDFSGADIKLPLSGQQEPTTAPTTAAGTTRPPSTTPSSSGNTTTQPAATQPGETTTGATLKPIPTIAVTEYVTDEDGSKVFVTDENGSTLYVTTVVYETADGTQAETDENGNPVNNPDGQPDDGRTVKIVIIVLIAAAVLGGGAFAFTYFKKKK